MALFFALLVFSCVNLRVNYYHVSDDRKGVYYELGDAMAEEDDLVVMIECRYLMYDPHDFLQEGQELIDLYHVPEAEIYETFMERVNDGDNVVLALFEKGFSHGAYTYFDNDPNFSINQEYNGFKLVRPVA